MIQYDPNRHWIRDIGHLGASWTLRRLAKYTLLSGLYSFAVSIPIIHWDLEGHQAISGTFSLLGVILSIILAFRTNSAYDRWWEGRKLWGSLVNHSRNLAIQLDALLPPEDMASRESFANLIAGFAQALSGHLRGQADVATLIGTGDDDGGCDPATDPPDHIPAHIARVIVRRIAELRHRGLIDGPDMLATKPHTQALLDVAGACERIRKTPIPFSYSVFIKLYILVYAAILPFGLIPEYGYVAVPLVMLIFFALLGLELMAGEIEDPFGLDCNDLPTGTIADTIRYDATELLGLTCPARKPMPQPYSKVF